jgi:hypothetical protein
MTSTIPNPNLLFKHCLKPNNENLPPSYHIEDEFLDVIFEEAMQNYNYAALKSLVLNNDFKYSIKSLSIIIDSEQSSHPFKTVPLDFLDSVYSFSYDDLTDEIAQDLAKEVITKSKEGEYVEIIYWMTLKAKDFGSTLHDLAKSLGKRKVLESLAYWKIPEKEKKENIEARNHSRWYDISEIEIGCSRWREYCYNEYDDDNNSEISDV